jgi:hypothetical protein
VSWTIVFTVTDCQTQKAISAVASDDEKAVIKNGPDKFTLTADGGDSAYTVLIQAGGYLSKQVTFQSSQAGTLQTVCLEKAPPPPPPVPFGPPAITSYYVQAGVLTVEFSPPQDISDFNMRLEALDGPFPLQPSGTRTFDGTDTKCIWENVLGGHRYRFSIQSVDKGFLKTNYSDWVAVEFDVSVDTGWVPPMQKVRAVSRNPSQLDVVAIAANQQAWARSWTAGTPWSAWQPIGGNFPAGNAVTLVSRNPNQLDLFTMGGNGHVYTSWWGGGSWSGTHGWADIGLLFPAGNTITPVTRNPNQLDLFVVGGNGHVYTSEWTAGSVWSGLNGWRDIGALFPAGNTVAAVSRNPNQLDLFVVGGNGHVYTSWHTDGSDWSGLNGWRDIGAQFPAGNTVTAISRNSSQIDLFVMGGNGHVYTSWWTAGSDWSGIHGWRDIGFLFPGGNSVTATSRNPNQIDLFVVGGNGHVYTSWWYAGSDWSGIKGWSDLGGAFPAGATVSAVTRNPNQIDLFVVHGDGTVWTTWWTAGATWVPWHPVAA